MTERLIVRVCRKIKLKHCSYRTEESYCHWIKALFDTITTDILEKWEVKRSLSF